MLPSRCFQLLSNNITAATKAAAATTAAATTTATVASRRSFVTTSANRIAVGDKLPEVTVFEETPGGAVRSGDERGDQMILRGKSLKQVEVIKTNGQ